jgi:hypothetical protein
VRDEVNVRAELDALVPATNIWTDSGDLAIDGTAGVGKTALTVHWGTRSNRGRFRPLLPATLDCLVVVTSRSMRAPGKLRCSRACSRRHHVHDPHEVACLLSNPASLRVRGDA